MEFQGFSGARSRQSKLRTNKAMLWVVAFIAAVIVIGILASLGGSGDSSPNRGSQGKAEIACERAIENEAGTKPRVEYTTIDENDTGDFTLYGYVKGEYSTAKFICNVTGAVADGNASARVNFFN